MYELTNVPRGVESRPERDGIQTLALIDGETKVLLLLLNTTYPDTQRLPKNQFVHKNLRKPVQENCFAETTRVQTKNCSRALIICLSKTQKNQMVINLQSIKTPWYE